MSEIRTDTINNASGDNDSGIDLSTNDKVAIKIADAEVATVDTTGVVFNDASADRDFRVESNGDANTFFVNGANGRIGLGTTSPDAELHIEPADDGSNASIVIADNGRSQYYRIQNNDSNDVLTFNKSDATQIMQITGVNVGIFSTEQTARLNVESNTAQYTIVSLKNNNSSNGGYFIAFTNSSGTLAGGISHNGSTTVAYNTSSDHRLKENVTADWDATTRLKQLNPVRFNFIDNADTTVDGFLAHEVQTIVPEAITGTHNEVDGDGNPVYQGIDQSKLVPLLVKTIQELEARITALENA